MSGYGRKRSYSSSRAPIRRMTYKKKPTTRVSTVSRRAWALNNVSTQFSSAIAPNGVEIKNFYTDLYHGAIYTPAGVPAGGNVITAPDPADNAKLINQIAVDASSSGRVGRHVKLNKFSFRWCVQAPFNGGGNAVRMVVIFDRRPRQIAVTWGDIFVSAHSGGFQLSNGVALTAMMRESNDGRFEVLLDKTITVAGNSAPLDTGGGVPGPATDNYSIRQAMPDSVKVGQEVIDLSAKRFFTLYTPTGVTGKETEIEYGAMYMFAWSMTGGVVNTANDFERLPSLTAFSELCYTEM